MKTIFISFNSLIRFLLPLLLLETGGCDSIRSQSGLDECNSKTLSPYFYIAGENPEADELPLKSTSADVQIAGVIANVKVTQVYKNEGKTPVEAVYIFPASTRAAVHDMKMTIGKRVIQAIIMEREKAKEEYEIARNEGKSASLLEQQRPNVFSMNVANIMPGDEIRVELFYSEVLIPEKGIYEFIYPAVVGPRYSGKPEENASAEDKWVSNPYTREGVQSMYQFDIQLRLNAGIPVKDITCPSHKTDIVYQGVSTAMIHLMKGNEYEGNRDFIMKYRLQGDQIQTGVLFYEGKEENFFLAMVQPPVRVIPSQIPPREYVFIMDVSGSMNGFPIEISKRLMRNLLSNLRSTDRFNVVLFAGASSLLGETSLPVNEANIRKAIALIDKQEGGGGTELIPALQKALSLKGSDGYARTFVIATDGYVDVERETFDLIRNNPGNAGFFAFGIGTSVNRYIIEGMARAGNGEPFIVEQPEKADVVSERFREYIQTPVMTNIRVTFDGLQVYDAAPMTFPTLYAERPLLIYGKYKGPATGKLTISGQTGEGKFSKTTDMGTIHSMKENEVLRYLWARNRILLLDDYSRVPGSNFEEIKKEVITLGLKYNLLTAFTSFIAIDSEVRNNTGKYTSIKQPLPLPSGVNNHAIGISNAGYARKSLLNSYAPALREEAINAPEELKVESNDLITEIEEQAKFQGGDISEFVKWIKENLHSSEKNPGSGKVYIKFTVDDTGNLVNILILKGDNPLLNREVLRILKSSPSWLPARSGGKTVKQTFFAVVEL